MSSRIINRDRGPEIQGTRITVYDVWEYVRAGWQQTAIASLFRLSSDEVRAALDYIEAHEPEVTAEYARIMQRINLGNPPELQEKFDASRARLQARLRKRSKQEPELAEHPSRQ